MLTPESERQIHGRMNTVRLLGMAMTAAACHSEATCYAPLDHDPQTIPVMRLAIRGWPDATKRIPITTVTRGITVS